jgi:hypothetical protein
VATCDAEIKGAPHRAHARNTHQLRATRVACPIVAACATVLLRTC